jgi:hypothetical protein
MLPQPDKDDGVIGEILSDPGQIRAHLDAEFAQVVAGTDPGAHQECGRVHTAGGENDLARA